MTKRFYCTLFDKNYILKGVAMLRSLHQHSADYHVFVLCLDDFVEEIISQLAFPHVTCIRLSCIETPDLLVAKQDRTSAEYCWTLSACLPFYVFNNYDEVDLITYLDADLFFYSSPEPIFEELSTSSIGITEHRFSPRLKHLEVNGKYCVQWVTFKRDNNGLSCLEKWRDQCIEWCYYRLEDDRMGDQKYLDTWVKEFDGVCEIQHIGAGVAPWNFDQYQIADWQSSIYVNELPVIFYHFHQFQPLDNGTFFRLSDEYRLLKDEPKEIYEQYESSLHSVLKDIRLLDKNFSYGLLKSPSVENGFIVKIFKRFMRKAHRLFFKFVLKLF